MQNPYYEFIERLEEKDSCNSFLWIVKCKKCGREYKAVPAQLTSPIRRRGSNPCSCWRNLSKGVLKIEQILTDNGLDFDREVSFSDCKSPKNALFYFDFFVRDPGYIIEYDGEQHFLPMSFGDTKISGEEKLKINQEHDNLKNNYCLEHNIPIIRIPYTHFNNLSIQDLTLTEDNPWLITAQQV